MLHQLSFACLAIPRCGLHLPLRFAGIPKLPGQMRHHTNGDYAHCPPHMLRYITPAHPCLTGIYNHHLGTYIPKPTMDVPTAHAHCLHLMVPKLAMLLPTSWLLICTQQRTHIEGAKPTDLGRKTDIPDIHTVEHK